MQWDTFQMICVNEMKIRPGCTPELSWRYSKGGPKTWTMIRDEASYRRMMESAAARVRKDAPKAKAANKVSRIGHDWSVELMVRNSVGTIPDEVDETVLAQEEEDEKEKKSKGKSTKRKYKGKQPKKVRT